MVTEFQEGVFTRLGRLTKIVGEGKAEGRGQEAEGGIRKKSEEVMTIFSSKYLKLSPN
jgi:hypothetical protein